MDFINTPPPALISWIAVIAVFLRFGLWVLDTWVKKAQRNADTLHSKLEGYWYRSVIMPVIIEPLISLTKSATSALTTLPHQATDSAKRRCWIEFRDEHVKKIADLRSSSPLLGVLGMNKENYIEEGLEEIEDFLAITCQTATDSSRIENPMQPADCADKIWETTSSITKKLIKEHKNFENN